MSAPRQRREGMGHGYDRDKVEVVFVPSPPEEAEAAWRRWIEAMDWLASVGAHDA